MLNVMNVKELSAFSGVIDYDRGYCKELAELPKPLLNVLRKGIKWKLSSMKQKEFIYKAIKKSYLIRISFTCKLMHHI